ncbi:TPA: hypothetical protein DIC20_02915 [Candidatus Dependentiae bacterium]|nr:MAG: ATP synthase gamma chain [candidate division TM6 bacterium GW2011_GWF2_36_131]KKQ02877.1 MAG: ATP synthase gamma chain [candidate division TM6 bacterium GW2011_GWE2_36_25]KKQ19529.1 MAG: ATP synthase gamma chain [candidate division TM6 bacterium GW2011_GWA2_36_9]HBR70242.1 hypothetical protein [Candidatus Dependentiae bacterium]HCU00626.1 hypothetical protein [Candidatus Dependentiae bacterium]
MSQLIQMNQRINAIETIKKITHATRLIAMSSHTRLANKEPILTHYKNKITQLFAQLINYKKDFYKTLFNFSPTANGSLIILVGSQKGFCGTFNVMLFKFFESKFSHLTKDDGIIAIGKKAADYLKKKKIQPLEIFSNLSSTTLNNITDLISEFIEQQIPNYKEVIIISNEPKSFFLQKPHLTMLLPIAPLPEKKQLPFDTYIWPESEQQILKNLGNLYLSVNLNAILFSSLVSEQAARFQSMDNATRNAEELLDVMRRDYNKLRQTKITRELIELTSSFER